MEEYQLAKREFAQQLLHSLKCRRSFDPNLFRGALIAPFETVDSTMNVVHALREDSTLRERAAYRVSESYASDEGNRCEAPIVALAREQLAGRGRMNRVWLSRPETGLYATYLFESEKNIDAFVGFSLAAGIAVLRTASDFGVSAKLKWPNDLWTVGLDQEPIGKLAGILIESKVSADRRARIAVGIGFNLLPVDESLPYQRSSLAEHVPGGVLYADAFAALTIEVFRVWNEFLQFGLEPFLKEWECSALLTGRKVSGIYQGETITGVALGVDRNGGLIVRLLNGSEVTLLSHEVTIGSFSKREPE